MELVRLQNIRKSYGFGPVLADVNLRVLAGQKVGLIGANGAGKTTLVRIIIGDESPDAGTVTRAPALRIGHVPQHVTFGDDETVSDCLLATHSAAEQALRRAEEHLARADAAALADAEARYDEASAAYERAGGDGLPQRAKTMLDALGLAGRDGDRVGALSGGEKNVLSLTKALLEEPDLLVLDEPGNHLDFEGLAWIEEFLRRFKGAVLIVSHNRYLLDRVAGGILHLEAGGVRSYTGNYSAYRMTALREKVAQQADYVADQKRLAQIEEMVRRFEEFARRTADPAWGKRLRARRSQLERAQHDATEKPAAEASSIRLQLTSDVSRADVALQVRGYCRAFGERRLFQDADLDIACGERVALVGPNGSGKTTLLRDIVAHGAWDHPVLRVGPSLRVGYCAQEQEVLDDTRTVLGQMLLLESMTRERAFGVLRQFLFGRNDLDRRIGDLSGGERNRLQLAVLMTQQPDFLILDEPTNHLDIAAREAIEEALSAFTGTMLVVSHDRYFLDKIAGRVVEVRDAGLVAHEGNFSEFWLARAPRTPAGPGRIATRRRQRERPAPVQPSPRSNARSAELQARLQLAERERIEIEARVAAAFIRGDHREGTRAAGELERLKARIDRMYDEWVAAEGDASSA
ncbi:MAG: ABC-F family ATP-binding cassette domain-containing protein [Chloroflexi bacterium]|nr:ABC-F family ATP-binding cassette domain-containing protein [Chloroflexota bacterium]